MTTRALASLRIPDYRWWALLAAVIATGLLGNWVLAVGVLSLFIVLALRPLDFTAAFLAVVAGASWVNNVGGRLTFELGLLAGGVLIMLDCYVFACRSRVFTIAKTPLTLPLMLFVGLTMVNVVRGFLQGFTFKNVNLELFPLLGLGSALLVANAFEPRRDQRLAVVAVIGIGFASAAQGFYKFATEGAHATDTYTVAFPGIVGLLLVNMALRAENRTTTAGWLTLSLPMFLHQFVTFGRGLWMGCLAGLMASVIILGGFGPGSVARWRRAGLVILTLIGLGVAGAFQVAIISGQTDILENAGTRLISIGSTKPGYETRSNLIRIWESMEAIRTIKQSPWFGHGIGFTFLVKEPFSSRAAAELAVHENFLLVWLKQGVVGLAVFLWMLAAAVGLGAREARRRADPWESAWLATSAAATVFLAVFALSNFPFGLVNEMFLLALLWGGSMAMAHEGLVSIRWSSPAPPNPGGAA
jgi:O-antigen ligase